MLTKIDIKEDLTYGQRIDLGELFESDMTEEKKFVETFFILHKNRPDFNNRKEIKFFVEYFKEITEGILYWIEKEKLLRYDPEPEEIRAGVYDLCNKIGNYGTIKALAKNYNCDPDDIFKWKYGKVFGILYTDLEEYKYQKRLHKIQMDSVKSKYGNHK